jgi:hypothetical protein
VVRLRKQAPSSLTDGASPRSLPGPPSSVMQRSSCSADSGCLGSIRKAGRLMPRVDRRKKPLGRGNDEQRQVLLYGDVTAAIFSEPVFASVAEERQAWFSLREEVLRECRAHFGPGRRPAGYFKFELACEPVRWYEEIAVLLQHGLIDQSEAIGIEQMHQTLSPGQSDGLCSGFDDQNRIVQMQLSECLRAHLAQEFDVAAEWHTWRGRAELAERYRTRAEVIRQVAGVETA